MPIVFARPYRSLKRSALCVWLVAISMACGSGNAPPGDGGADDAADDSRVAADATDTGADSSDPNFCVRSSDCFVAADDCCNTDCDSVGRIPLGTRDRLAYLQSCADRGCHECRIGPEWVPFCVDNRCTIVELGTSSLSSCRSHTECELRWGSRCCELCFPDQALDLVSMARFAPLCSTGDSCDPCLSPPYPEGATSICVSSHCKVQR